MAVPDDPLAPLTPAVRDVMRRCVLCWLATVDADGQPNVSPKEVFAPLDAHRLAIAHIASPVSLRNLRAEARVCVSMIDPFVQKGLKTTGRARVVLPGEQDFDAVAAPLRAMTGERFPIHAVFVVDVTSVVPIVAPSYRLYPETTEAMQIASAMKIYGVRPA